MTSRYHMLVFRFQTDRKGAVRATIFQNDVIVNSEDETVRVGIGIESPTNRLTVVDNGMSELAVAVIIQDDSNVYGLRVQSAQYGTEDNGVSLHIDGANNGVLRMFDADCAQLGTARTGDRTADSFPAVASSSRN